MALKLVSDWTLDGTGQYKNYIDLTKPLTIEQDGGQDDITQITPTFFRIYNDGMRRDPVFDPANGTPMSLKYENILITPKSFTTYINNGSANSNGTSTKLYLTATAVSTPANLNIQIGSVLTIQQTGGLYEDVLVLSIGGDSYGSYVNVIRNYRNVSSNNAPLNSGTGDTVIVSTKHIYLSKSSDFTGVQGGNALTLNDVTTSISTPTINPDPSTFQTIYIKAVPMLQKTPVNGSQTITRIPTQFKTDVYFEISYRELPN